LRICLKIGQNGGLSNDPGVAFSLVSFFWRSKRKILATGETLLKSAFFKAKKQAHLLSQISAIRS